MMCEGFQSFAQLNVPYDIGENLVRFKLGTTANEGVTTSNEGTRGSLIRMKADVVYYSWAAIYTSI